MQVYNKGRLYKRNFFAFERRMITTHRMCLNYTTSMHFSYGNNMNPPIHAKRVRCNYLSWLLCEMTYTKFDNTFQICLYIIILMMLLF
jgi:hypothetical protein